MDGQSSAAPSVRALRIAKKEDDVLREVSRQIKLRLKLRYRQREKENEREIQSLH